MPIVHVVAAAVVAAASVAVSTHGAVHDALEGDDILGTVVVEGALIENTAEFAVVTSVGVHAIAGVAPDMIQMPRAGAEVPKSVESVGDVAVDRVAQSIHRSTLSPSP